MEATGGLAPYRIDAEIAHSSICTIYRAYEESLERPVLIKKLHPQMAREEDIRKRFEREAQVCARVKHENIVDIFSYRADAEATFLVMEFVQGESLGDLLKRQGRIEWRAALAMLAGVLKGLAHAHSKGVFHRDIKPDNLLLSNDGKVKITDFGLAMIADSSRMTVQDAVVGTPAYLPPEQVSGGKTDHRGDIFSTGVTFYEMLTGTSPFSGESFSETLKKILTYNPPSLSSLIPEIPAEFDQILARMLEKQPSRRAASAEAVLEEVKRFAELKGVKLEASTVQESLLHNSPDSVSKSAVVLPPAPSGLSQATLPVWTLGLTAILIAVIVFMFPTRTKLVGDGLPKLKKSFQESSSEVGKLFELRTQSNRPEIAAREPAITIDTRQTNLLTGTGDHSPNPTPKNDRNQGNAGVSIPQRDPENALPGKLLLTSKPWAMVTIDNVSYGQTPLKEVLELSAGEHVITLNNPEFPSPFSETVVIESGETFNLDANLWEQVGVIQVLAVKPWAEVFVDGVSYGLTPRAKPIIVSFGSHSIELRNPSFKIWNQSVQFGPANRQVDLSVQLEGL